MKTPVTPKEGDYQIRDVNGRIVDNYPKGTAIPAVKPGESLWVWSASLKKWLIVSNPPQK